MLLAGDVGGTKTKLGIFSESDLGRPIRVETYASDEFASLEDLCRAFLDSGEPRRERVTRAALGVPGPVVDERARMTNLPWLVDANRLEAALDLEQVVMFNDLVAVARAVPLLGPEDVQTIVAGRADDDGPVAVVAPGTGLGVAYGLPGPGGLRVVASEGGHVDFAPIDPLQDDLLRFLRLRYDRVSYERVCSGPAIPELYEFFRDSGRYPEPTWLADRLAAAHDRARVISEAAFDQDRTSMICRATIRLFARILAAKAGNEALGVVATGGVYLAGGVPPRILPALADAEFREAFVAKGRMRPFLERIGVHVVTTDLAALIGAASLGSMLPGSVATTVDYPT